MGKIVRVLISSLELFLAEIRDLNRYDDLRNPESFRDTEIPNADLWLSYPNAGEEFIGMTKDENDRTMKPWKQEGGERLTFFFFFFFFENFFSVPIRGRSHVRSWKLQENGVGGLNRKLPFLNVHNNWQKGEVSSLTNIIIEMPLLTNGTLHSDRTGGKRDGEVVTMLRRWLLYMLSRLV